METIVSSHLLRTVLLFSTVALAGTSTKAEQQRDALPTTVDSQNVALRIARECKAVAAIADHGAKALRTVDLTRRGVPIDLGNKGHPQVVRVEEEGTAHFPVLTDAHDQPLPHTGPDAYLQNNDIRFAGEISVLGVNRRVWQVAWNAGSLDNLAVLNGATDGVAVCYFHPIWETPKLKLMAGGDPSKVQLYRDLLLGRGQAAPSAELDAKSVELPPNLHNNWFSVGPLSWTVDLTNSGHPLPLIAVHYDTSAGPGASEAQLGLVQAGKVTRLFDARPGSPLPPLVPLSSALVTFLNAAPIPSNTRVCPHCVGHGRSDSLWFGGGPWRSSSG